VTFHRILLWLDKRKSIGLIENRFFSSGKIAGRPAKPASQALSKAMAAPSSGPWKSHRLKRTDNKKVRFPDFGRGVSR
jgi:hypothetical protein